MSKGKQEQVYCTKHKQGSFNKESDLQKEHESNSKGKCKFVKYNPKKHNPKYKKSKIKGDYRFYFTNGSAQITQDILDTNINTLRPQTILIDGTKIILVYLPTKLEIVKGTGDNIVTSYEYLNSAYFVMCDKSNNKKILPFNDQYLTENYKIKVLSEWNDVRWNVLDLKKWLTEKTKTDPKILYNLINNTTRKYLEYSSESEYTKFNIWNVATYFFELFESFPYNNYTGMKRAGKTKSLQFQKLVCFNSIMSADITSSATFRIIEGIGATILLDETESFKDKKNEQAQAIRNILMQGFLRDQYAVRNETTKDKNFTPTQYNLYSPKSMAHIRTFDDTLEERCIQQTLKRALNEKIKNTWCTEEDKSFSEIRNLCYRLFLDYADEVNQLKDEARKLLKVNSRELQLWTPVITLALFFERHGVSNLTNDIQLSVSQSSENRQIDDEQELIELKILSFLDKVGIRIAQDKTIIGNNNRGWILISTLFGQLTDRSSEYDIPEWFTKTHLRDALRKLGFVQNRTSSGNSWFITKSTVDEAKKRMGTENIGTTLDSFDGATPKTTTQGTEDTETTQTVIKSTNVKNIPNSETIQTTSSETTPSHENVSSADNVENVVKTTPIVSSHSNVGNVGNVVDTNNKTTQTTETTHFKCLTCDAGEFRITSKQILEYHTKQGHIIEYLNLGDDSS